MRTRCFINGGFSLKTLYLMALVIVIFVGLGLILDPDAYSAQLTCGFNRLVDWPMSNYLGN